MEFNFKAECVLTLEHNKGKTKHLSTDFNLELSEGLNKDVYLDKEGLPTKQGSEALTNVFIQGLVGNIHQAHENGYRDSAEHLRYIIAELERGFVAVTEVTKSYF